jgi:hypothetical protein
MGFRLKPALTASKGRKPHLPEFVASALKREIPYAAPPRMG